jgi:cytochrome c556
MIVRTVLAVAALAVGVTAVVAQGDPIADRRAAMKAVGEQNRVATDAFKAEMAEVRKNCGGCHQTYRKRQS